MYEQNRLLPSLQPLDIAPGTMLFPLDFCKGPSFGRVKTEWTVFLFPSFLLNPAKLTRIQYKGIEPENEM